MQLSVSYNGDLELIDKLKEYDSVAHIFGALSKDITGGGRSTSGLPVVTKDIIEESVSKAHKNNIEFNYLINSSCMGNKEFSKAKYKEIVEHLAWLDSIGVDWVTIANPYIIEICKSRHPNIKISLSSFAMVESVERAKFYDEIGVDEITVRENINRNFKLLENIQKSVNCKIQVLVNQTCLYQCPYQFYHDNIMSHGSQIDNSAEEVFIDYCILKCVQRKFNNKSEIIKSCWIRPEDMREYEAIGIDKFKITDRGKSTEWLTKVVKSYHERNYDGNLADILNIVQTHNKRNSGSTVKIDNSKVNEEIKKIRKMMKAFMLLDINIDNKGLDGFINHFKNTECRTLSCESCGYCKKVGDKVVSFPNETDIAKALEEINEINNSMLNKAI